MIAGFENYRRSLYAIYAQCVNGIDDFAIKNKDTLEALLELHGCEEEEDEKDFGKVTHFTPFPYSSTEANDEVLKSLGDQFVNKIESQFDAVDTVDKAMIKCFVAGIISGCIVSLQMIRWIDRQNMQITNFKDFVEEYLYGVCEIQALRVLYDIECDLAEATLKNNELSLGVSFAGVGVFLNQEGGVSMVFDPGCSRTNENELFDIIGWKSMTEATCEEYCRTNEMPESNNTQALLN